MVMSTNRDSSPACCVLRPACGGRTQDAGHSTQDCYPPAMRKLFALLVFIAAAAQAADVPFAPDRRPGEGDGPFARLIIRGATLVDGTGAPPVGPVDIVIEGNRIKEIRSVGFPRVPIKE